jgi:hypothetical protein
VIDGPFADAGPSPSLRCAALGLVWTISPDSQDAATCAAAERLAAAVSVLSAVLVDEDLCLLPGEIIVHVSAEERSASEEPSVPEPADDGSWSVVLGTGEKWLDAPESVSNELVMIVGALLFLQSLLPAEQYRERLQGPLAAGRAQVFVGRAYDQLLDAASMGFPVLRCETEPPWTGPLADEHPALVWRTGPGPTYSRERALDNLQNRYAKLLPPIRLTIERILAEPEIAARIDGLRAEGLLDWQVLQVIHGITLGHRMPPEAAEELTREELEAIAFRSETAEDEPVPLELFSDEAFKVGQYTGAAATLQVWDLDLRAPRPSPDAVLRVLIERYRHRIDDIAHADPFPQVASGH